MIDGNEFVDLVSSEEDEEDSFDQNHEISDLSNNVSDASLNVFESLAKKGMNPLDKLIYYLEFQPEMIDLIRRMVIDDDEEFQRLKRNCNSFIREKTHRDNFVTSSLVQLEEDVCKVVNSTERLGNPLNVVTQIDGREEWNEDLQCIRVTGSVAREVDISQFNRTDIPIDRILNKNPNNDSGEESSVSSDEEPEEKILEEEIIECEAISSSEKEVPSVGKPEDFEIKIGSYVLVPEKPEDSTTAWMTGRVKAIQSLDGISHHFSVEVSRVIKSYPSSQVIVQKPQTYRLEVKQRVVAVHRRDPTSKINLNDLRAGFVAEIPSKRSNYCYLIFFDDESVAYVPHKECYANFKLSLDSTINCLQSDKKVDRQYTQFLTRYFQDYPERPLLRLAVKNKIKVLVKENNYFNGFKNHWRTGRIRKVFGSLCLVEVRQTKEKIWMSRGSFRLKEVYEHYFPPEPKSRKKKILSSNDVKIVSRAVRKLQIAPAKKIAASPSSQVSSQASSQKTRRKEQKKDKLHKREKSRNVLEFMDDNTQDSDSSNESTKSLTNRFQSRVPSSRYPQRVVHSRVKNPTSFPKQFKVDHQSLHPADVQEPKCFSHNHCSIDCLNLGDIDKDYDPEWERSAFRHQNPYTMPLFVGWKRLLLTNNARKKSKDGADDVIYRTPCGKNLRDIEEVYMYLNMTESRLPLEYFVFDPNLELFTEKKVIGCYFLDEDISHGQEKRAISCVNEIDDSPLPSFKYVTHLTFSDQIDRNCIPLRPDFKDDPENPFVDGFNACCSCTDDCQTPENCACQRMTHDETKIIYLVCPDISYGYKFKRLEEQNYTGIYECNSRCSCSKNCLNRLAQLGIRQRLQVFKTAKTGWGIRALHDIPKGAFLCQYIAKVLTPDEGNIGGKDDTYYAGLDLLDHMEGNKISIAEHPDDFVEDPDDEEEVKFVREAYSGGFTSLRDLFREEFPYVVDAIDEGNIARFFNHSCDPNVIVQNVFIHTHDPRFHTISLFTKQLVKSFEELTWDYGYQVESVEGRKLFCKCGSKNCRKRLL